MTSTQVELDNIDRVRKGFEAFAASDIATLSELFEANAVWRAEPMGILSGNYDGRDAIFAMFAQVAQETAGTFRTVPTTMTASNDKVIVQLNVTGDRQGRKLNAGEVLVFTLVDGRIREVRLYQESHAQNAAFWA
jgi:ketosteroid isomerase-like protein